MVLAGERTEGEEMSRMIFRNTHSLCLMILAMMSAMIMGCEKSEKWVLVGSERLLLDLQTGEIESVYPVRPGEMIAVVNDQYWLIQRPLDNPRYWLAKQFETALYDVWNRKEVWTLPGSGSGAILEDGVLYIMWDGLPTALEAKTGRKLWEVETRFPREISREANRIHSSGSFMIFKDYILFPYGSDLLLMCKADGSLQYRLNDMLFGYPGFNPYLTRQIQRINRDEHYVYVGSANGMFSKIKIQGGW